LEKVQSWGNLYFSEWRVGLWLEFTKFPIRQEGRKQISKQTWRGSTTAAGGRIDSSDFHGMPISMKGAFDFPLKEPNE